jgi:hypothetical protein
MKPTRNGQGRASRLIRACDPQTGLGRRYHQAGWLGDQPQEVPVPSLAAGLVASLAGWMIDDVVQPYLGAGATLVLSLVCSTVIFFVARKWLIELRGR